MSKSKFGLANAYGLNNEFKKRCEMYALSIVDYKKGKELNPNSGFRFNPTFSSFEEMVQAFTNEYCN